MILKTSEIVVPSEYDKHDSEKLSQVTHVLHLINGEHFAGAERVQDLLANSLSEFGYQADFACLKPGKFKDVRTSCVQIFDIHMKNSFDVFAANRVAKIALREGYRLIHAHTPRTLMIGAIVARKLDLPLVYHVHSPVGRDSTRRIRNKINTWVESWSLRNVSALICVSQSVGNYMKELGHDETKIHVVRNGVPCSNNNSVRKVPGGCWTIGTMALYRPRKGIETLLEGLALLKQQNLNIRLRAVGGFETPEYEAEVKSLATQLAVEDVVDWTGFQTDVNAQFEKMDLFVLPSLFGEGLPMVVLEAMAHGVPVVASNVEGIPEAVRDGVDGLIFEPGSPVDLADRVCEIVRDKKRWQEMSINSVDRQQNELSDFSMARGVAAVYDQITRRFETE